MDKSWMTIKNRMSKEYREGVKQFVDFAVANSGSDDEIRCPCLKCMNVERHVSIVVAFHLVQNGMAPSYKTWVHHGETIPVNQPYRSNESGQHSGENVGDGMTGNEQENQEDLEHLLNDYHAAYAAGIINDDELDELPDNAETENVRKVWELSYVLGRSVVLFQCEWFNTGSSRTIKVDPHFTSIDVRSRWYVNDPFVLPSQVKQVFYVNDTKFGDNWKVVEQIQHRGIWDIPEGDGSEPSDTPTDAFQQNETTNAVPIVVDDSVEIRFTREDVEPEIIPSTMVLQSQNQQHSSSLPEEDEDEDESMGELSDDEENELRGESDSDIDPDVEP